MDAKQGEIRLGFLNYSLSCKSNYGLINRLNNNLETTTQFRPIDIRLSLSLQSNLRHLQLLAS